MASQNAKNKKWGVFSIIKKGKYDTFQNHRTVLIINRNLSCNSKNVVYIIHCPNSKHIYAGWTQSLNNRVSLHKSNIKLSNN